MPSLAELEAEVAELNDRLRVTSSLLMAMRLYEDKMRAYEEKIGTKVHQTPAVTFRRRSRPVPATKMNDTERVAAELMETKGGPVSSSEVVAGMKDRGVPVPEKKPVNVISARLSNNKRFKGKRGSGYWFADRDWPDEASQPSLGVHENEAPNGEAAGASETGEAATSPSDTRDPPDRE